MMNRTIPVISLLVLITGGLIQSAPAAHAADKLTPGNYVPDLVPRRYTEPYVLQRLTERTYWVAVAAHGSLFYVGDEGVIVFDPLSSGWGNAILQAIDSVTDLPVAALVYSHHHLDHIGDAQLFVEAANVRGSSLRIIASAATAAQVERYGNQVPPPTEVIAEDPGMFRFEALRVRAQSTGDAHAIDNTSYLLEQEEVLHYVDSVESEDLVPYFRLGGILDLKPTTDALRSALDMDWKFLSTGHGNVGSKKDIEKHLELIADIRAATQAAMAVEPFGDYVDMEVPDAIVWIAAHEEAVAARAREKLRPKYGTSLRFDATIDAHIIFMMGDIGHFGGK